MPWSPFPSPNFGVQSTHGTCTVQNYNLFQCTNKMKTMKPKEKVDVFNMRDTPSEEVFKEIARQNSFLDQKEKELDIWEKSLQTQEEKLAKLNSELAFLENMDTDEMLRQMEQKYNELESQISSLEENAHNSPNHAQHLLELMVQIENFLS